MIGYEAIQTRIANRKKEREKGDAGTKPVKGSNKKRVKKTKEARESEQDANETRARELICLLARALKSIHHHEETGCPNPTVLLSYHWQQMWPRYTSPVPSWSSKPSSWRDWGPIWGTLIQKTMNHIRPRQRESLVDWLTKIFSAFGGVPSGPACSPVGILPLRLWVCKEHARWSDVGFLVVSVLAVRSRFAGETLFEFCV